MRTVVVHYHIFKNAGSTIDQVLERTFGSRWTTFDTDDPAGRISQQELTSFILSRPELLAVSSHQAVPQLPAVPDMVVLPILLLRHPLDRARSVYDFERRQGQQSGPISRGADHALRLSFYDYLRWRFDSAKNGVVHNYQTAFLCSSARNVYRNDIRDADLAVAQGFLETLPAFGLVERFDQSLSWLARAFMKWGMSLDIKYQASNVSNGREVTLEARLQRTRDLLGESMWDELLERNYWDLRLYEFARVLFADRHDKFFASLDSQVISMPRTGAAS